MALNDFPIGDLGPANVLFGGTDLGRNLAVRVSGEDTSAPIKAAQNGEASIDDIHTGRTITVEADMVQSSLAQLAAVMLGTTQTNDELMIQDVTGKNARGSAAKLVIKPIIEGVQTTDEKKWLTFFVAAPIKSTPNWTFDVTSQRQTTVTFRCYEVEAEASGETYEVGDIGAIGYGQTT